MRHVSRFTAVTEFYAGVAAGTTAIVAGLIIAFRKPQARGVTGTEEWILVYGRALKALSVVVVGFAVFMTVMALWGYFLSPESGGWTPASIVLVAGLFWFLAGVLAIEVFRAWCRFSPSFIMRHSPWKGTLTIRWEEIETIRYEMGSEWYVLCSPRGTIRLHIYLDGIEEFVHLAHTRIPVERWGRGARGAVEY